MTRSLLLAGTLLLLPLPLLPGTLLHGQRADIILRGVVLDESGAPAPGVPVALHRITEAGGGLVANAESDAAGRFEVAVASDAADAVYFVAARYRDELYIGPTFRAPFPADSDYIVQVGIEEASASALLRGGDAIVAPPPTPWRWGLFAVFGFAFLLAAGLLLRHLLGPAPRRRLLIRIAELDERIEDAAAADQEAALRLERDHLFERLRTAE